MENTTPLKENVMQKILGALVMSLAVLGAAPSDAKAHDRHRSHGDSGFGFNFGDGGSFSFGFGSGNRQPAPSFAREMPTCGHWEYRTETYVVQAGYWSRVLVSDACGFGRWETVWVQPVYGSRTVRVWVNY